MKITTQDGLLVSIRWMIGRDMPEVLAIEREAFPDPWFEEEFIQFLKMRDCIGLVAEVKGEVVGFVVFLLRPDHLEIIDFAVRPDMQRHGIGRALWHNLVGKLSSEGRRRVVASVRQDNMLAQKFFSAMWFLCVGMIEGEEHGVDGYEFEYHLDPLDQDAARAAVYREEASVG